MGSKNTKSTGSDESKTGNAMPLGSVKPRARVVPPTAKSKAPKLVRAKPAKRSAIWPYSVLLKLKSLFDMGLPLLEQQWAAYLNAENERVRSRRFRLLREAEDKFKKDFLIDARRSLRDMGSQPTRGEPLYPANLNWATALAHREYAIRQIITKLEKTESTKEAFRIMYSSVFLVRKKFYRGEIEVDNPEDRDIKVGNLLPPMPEIVRLSPREDLPRIADETINIDAISQAMETAKLRVGEIVSFRDEDGTLYEMRAVPEERVMEGSCGTAAAMATAGEHAESASYEHATKSEATAEEMEDARESAAAAMATAGKHPESAYYKSRVKGETLEQFVIRAYLKFCTPGKYTLGDSPFPLRNIYQDQMGVVDLPLLRAVKKLAAKEGKEVPEYVLPMSARLDREVSRSGIQRKTASRVLRRAYRKGGNAK